jgi:hypothetical protein
MHFPQKNGRIEKLIVGLLDPFAAILGPVVQKKFLTNLALIYLGFISFS